MEIIQRSGLEGLKTLILLGDLDLPFFFLLLLSLICLCANSSVFCSAYKKTDIGNRVISCGLMAVAVFNIPPPTPLVLMTFPCISSMHLGGNQPTIVLITSIIPVAFQLSQTHVTSEILSV